MWSTYHQREIVPIITRKNVGVFRIPGYLTLQYRCSFESLLVDIASFGGKIQRRYGMLRPRQREEDERNNKKVNCESKLHPVLHYEALVCIDDLAGWVRFTADGCTKGSQL